MFKNPFLFRGRIRRTEYGITVIAVFGIFVVLDWLGIADYDVSVIITIPLLWVSLAQVVKRCHDINRSGFWIFFPFFSFVLLFMDGDPRRNDYGDDPKGRGSEDLLHDFLKDVK
ncbi:DUF805 domain-containing protein [Chitinophaga sp. Cy-1792]|uniref:DUF805 domain-containing protein n=1 Tax=Chitinophaga sp. Cy-1792 TaxID=2608339 RepID=UPI001422A788|nr:DUF805 domain-containing protein [Chitinophaga sp. Cy-1792]NIG57408.1 DUF805 domain-containing protein [Chitinophaga sp. Cy-1792]